MTRIGDIGTAKVIKSDEKYAFYVSLALLKPKHIKRVCNFLWAARSRLIDVGGDSVTK